MHQKFVAGGKVLARGGAGIFCVFGADSSESGIACRAVAVVTLLLDQETHMLPHSRHLRGFWIALKT